jgi:hypothetical protein
LQRAKASQGEKRKLSIKKARQSIALHYLNRAATARPRPRGSPPRVPGRIRSAGARQPKSFHFNFNNLLKKWIEMFLQEEESRKTMHTRVGGGARRVSHHEVSPTEQTPMDPDVEITGIFPPTRTSSEGNSPSRRRSRVSSFQEQQTRQNGETTPPSQKGG